MIANSPPKNDSRECLIRVGLDILLRKGYGATSINEVVQGAGVPKGSFYYYFKSKEEFVEAVLLTYAQEKHAQMNACFQNTALSPLNRVRFLLASYIRCMVADNFETGCLIGHMAQDIAASSPRLRDVLNTLTRDYHHAFRNIFEQAVKSGELPPETNLGALVENYFMLIQGALIESKISKSLRGFQNAHWLIFEQIGSPSHLLDAETEALLAISQPAVLTQGASIQ